VNAGAFIKKGLWLAAGSVQDFLAQLELPGAAADAG
jgi:hypothetical protein